MKKGIMILLNGIKNFISNMNTFTLILWLILIAWGIWELIQYFRRRNSAVALESEEFKKDLRRKQLIDVREKDEFDAGHILGARNIPFLKSNSDTLNYVKINLYTYMKQGLMLPIELLLN